MTAEKLQDAITLLPGDLVTATDRLRTVPRARVFYWKPVLATAACFILLLSAGFVFRRTNLMGTKTESAAAAPMAPAIMESQVTADGAVPELFVEEAAPETPMEIGGGAITEVPAAENGLCVDHSHRFAEAKKEAEKIPSGYCGNLAVRIVLNGEQHDLYGADADAATNILRSLDYDPNTVCRCMAEFTVDLETLAGIEVNLKEAFARCKKGQAALTEEQVAIFQEIIENLQ